VRAAEQRLVAANANVGAARAAFFPQITLTASTGSASNELSGLFAAGSKAWLFNPVLTFPLFDAGRVRGNVDVAEARKVQAVANYEKTIQQAFREVADSCRRQHHSEQVPPWRPTCAPTARRIESKPVSSWYRQLPGSAGRRRTSRGTGFGQFTPAAPERPRDLYKVLGGGEQ
jgi:multidrug efflux system outer membrane protein